MCSLPCLLLFILVTIFGNLDDTLSQLVFDVGLVAEEGSLVESVLTKTAGSDELWLNLYHGSSLNEELDALETGQRHAVIHATGNEVEVHIRQGIFMSEVAGEALQQVFASLNLELNRHMGAVIVPAVQAVYREVEGTQTGGEQFSYSAYIVPGIILMVFLNSGLGPMIQRLALDRERGILRRFFATPLKPDQYFGGILLYILVYSVVQVMLISGAGALLFDVHLSLLSWKPLFFLVLSLVTMLSLGIVIAGIAKTANSAVAAANGLMYPLMFLGGLYFPVLHLAYPLKLLVVANPVTYLVNGLRDSLGVYPSTTAFWLNVLVPVCYILAALMIGLRSFKWDA